MMPKSQGKHSFVKNISMRYNLTEIQNLIRDRRSIKPLKISTRKVHREQIEAMIQAANWAPTHGYTEPWRFKVFGGKAMQDLMQFNADLYKLKTPEEKFLPDTYNSFLERAKRVSYIVGVCMKRQESEVIPEVEEIIEVGCAVQNFALVAAAYGLGCFWSTGGFAFSAEMHEYMKLGPKDRFLGFLYVGYPEGEWPEPTKRGIWMNKVEWLE
jgi:nitroreductase